MMKYLSVLKNHLDRKTYLPINIKVISLEDAICLGMYLSLKENASFFGIPSHLRLSLGYFQALIPAAPPLLLS